MRGEGTKEEKKKWFGGGGKKRFLADEQPKRKFSGGFSRGKRIRLKEGGSKEFGPHGGQKPVPDVVGSQRETRWRRSDQWWGQSGSTGWRAKVKGGQSKGLAEKKYAGGEKTNRGTKTWGKKKTSKKEWRSNSMTKRAPLGKKSNNFHEGTLGGAGHLSPGWGEKTYRLWELSQGRKKQKLPTSTATGSGLKKKRGKRTQNKTRNGEEGPGTLISEEFTVEDRALGQTKAIEGPKSKEEARHWGDVLLRKEKKKGEWSGGVDGGDRKKG